MAQFEFFFAFYGLILGLAATEVLGGFGAFVRARAVRRLEPQTALLALLTFVAICSAWIDAWNKQQTVTIDFAGLWAPVLTATTYYLAATVVFPSDPALVTRESQADYYAGRKRFIVGMLLAAEMLVSLLYFPTWTQSFVEQPAVFWLFHVPYNMALKGLMVALLFVNGRKANITCLIALNLLILAPYWVLGRFTGAISAAFGY